MRRQTSRLARPLLALLLSTQLTGCLFYMNHELPPNTVFGGPVEKNVKVQHAEESLFKPYLLAGLLPYPFFPTKDVLKAPPKGTHLTNVSIETQFNWFDTVVWVVPGFFYGYYVFAPRHATVSGNYVQGERKVVPAQGGSVRTSSLR